MHCLLSVRCTCVLGSSLGALEVSVSVTASDMQSSVLQTSSRSHGENTRRGHWGPVATCTISASQLALSYIAKQIWPLILHWPIYAQISSIWGQKGGKESITVCLLLKGTIRVVYICILLQNAEKIRKEREKSVSSQKRSSKNKLSQELKPRCLPILLSMIFAGVAVHEKTIFKMRLWGSKKADKPWIPLPSCFPPSTEHFGESRCTKSHTHTYIKLCAHILKQIYYKVK